MNSKEFELFNRDRGLLNESENSVTEKPQSTPDDVLFDSLYGQEGNLNLSFLIENAGLLLENGEFELARNIYISILKSGEETALAYFGIGRCFHGEGQLSKAEKSFEESITYTPSFDVYRELVKVLVKQGKFDRATEIVERSMRLKDISREKLYEFHSDIGDNWMRAGRHRNAEVHYLRALELNPKDDAIHSKLGSVLLQENRVSEAITAYEDAVTLNGSNSEAYVGLGCCHLAESEKSIAHDCFAKALDNDINNPTAVFYLIKCAYEIKSYQRASELVDEYVKIAPVNANLLYSLAGLHYHLGNYSRSKIIVEQILGIRPEHKGANELRKLIEENTAN